MDGWILGESPGAYRWGSIEDPIVGADDVAVAPVASALNHMDLWLTRGRPGPKVPHVPGCDVAGVVQAVGTRVNDVLVGDEVVVNPAVVPLEDVMALGDDSPLSTRLEIVGEHRWGGHAGLVVVPARNVVPRPPGRTWEECAAYPIATLTAWRMLRRARLAAGERCLIVGVGSGVSAAALHLAVRMGAEVHVTSRDPAKREAALSMGAVAAYDSAGEWPVKVHVVVESVGPATWDRSLAALERGGRIAVCGGTSGQRVEIDLPRLFFRQVEVIGSTLGSYGEFLEVTRLVAQGLPVAVDATFGLDAYPQALARLDAGAQLGKIVVSHR